MNDRTIPSQNVARRAQYVMSESRRNVRSRARRHGALPSSDPGRVPTRKEGTVTTRAGSGVPPGTSGTGGPVVTRTRTELSVTRGALKGRVGVVMTMGALHEGHAALVREARATCDAVVMTIFLNPLQFGPKEDLARYPRTFDADLAICTAAGVDLVFAPPPDVVYPQGDPGVRVSAGPLGDVLEGQARPGHFGGMLTVVAKLMHLTRCSAAYFGQKDAQQLLLIRRMCRDLDFPVRVVSVPTVRESDGLAMSSRNTS